MRQKLFPNSTEQVRPWTAGERDARVDTHLGVGADRYQLQPDQRPPGPAPSRADLIIGTS